MGYTQNSKGTFFRKKPKLTGLPGTPDGKTDPAKRIQNSFHPDQEVEILLYPISNSDLNNTPISSGYAFLCMYVYMSYF